MAKIKKVVWVPMIFLGISIVLMYFCAYYIPFKFTPLHAEQLHFSPFDWHMARFRQAAVALCSIALFLYCIKVLRVGINLRRDVKN